MRSIKKIFFITAALLILSVSCGSGGSGSSGEPGEDGNLSAEAKYVRDTAGMFYQSAPLPRSFAGSAGHIKNSYQKLIAEKGVIIYDMAVMMKAMLLYPGANEKQISRIVDTLWNNHAIRSNKDFRYPGDWIPLGKGYFFKIIDVKGVWLQDQTLPITGENAWLANALAGVYETYKGSAMGDKAYQLLKELSSAMLSLQTDEGYIRMAPQDIPNGYGVTNYYNLVSVENNISVLPVFRYMASNGPLEDREKYKTAADKLEKALIGMYDPERGVFNTGMDLDNQLINRSFATDCQTWMILAIGAERFDTLMFNEYGIENAGLGLLKKTLGAAGVTIDGKYAGVDFSARKSYISYEWSLGFILSAGEILTLHPDDELREAVESIGEYISSNCDGDGLLPYADSAVSIPTGHGWDTIPLMPSLASTSWYMFYKLNPGVDPFVIHGRR